MYDIRLLLQSQPVENIVPIFLSLGFKMVEGKITVFIHSRKECDFFMTSVKAPAKSAVDVTDPLLRWPKETGEKEATS